MNILDYLDETVAKKATKTYDKGDFIHFENEYCGGVYFVISGLVEVSSTSLSGEKIVYNTLMAGNMFGNHLAFSSDPYFRGDVIAKEKSEVVYLEKEKLLSLLQGNRDFLSSYLAIQSDFGKRLNAKIKILGFLSAEERFRYYLFLNKGIIRYKSVSSLAEELNLKRETLSRLLSRLEKEGVIERENDLIRELS